MFIWKILGRDQGPVFRDGYFSQPEHVFTLGCERQDMRVYMKKKSGVRIRNLEVSIYVIVQLDTFWLLDTFFMLRGGR